MAAKFYREGNKIMFVDRYKRGDHPEIVDCVTGPMKARKEEARRFPKEWTAFLRAEKAAKRTVKLGR